MRGEKIRLIREPNKYFLLYHEKFPFPDFHYHPEYELSYIVRGKGKKIIGDDIEDFSERDLTFLGPNLPHEYKCMSQIMNRDDSFDGESIVIHFTKEFIGAEFFNLPENSRLKDVLKLSERGIQILGDAAEFISNTMINMLQSEESERLFLFLKIFRRLSSEFEYRLLSSPGITVNKIANDQVSMIEKAIQYIHENFNKDLKIKDVLELSRCSYTVFNREFKNATSMNFKDYLTKVRIGYACKLLIETNLSITAISFNAGFDNISNFNRQFKKIKSQTPYNFRKGIKYNS